jgi:hypothetical protein
MRRFDLLVAHLCLGTVLVIPAIAMAKGKEDRESITKAAKKACLLGEVEKGAEILADLYVETNDPTYIYNQGRCFEQNGKNDQALLRFKEYQRKAQGLSPEDLDALHKRIEDLEAASGRRQSPPPVGPVSPPPPPVIPSTAATAAPLAPREAGVAKPLGITQAGAPPEPAASPPVYKRWWFWTGLGAVIAGGVVTGVLLTRQSAPSSPPCDGLGACVP